MSRHFRSLLLACTFVIFANGFPQSNQSTESAALESKYQPYTVALKYKGFYKCSGVIISPNKILTAKTCINDCIQTNCSEHLTVYTGSANLLSGGNVYRIHSVAVPTNTQNVTKDIDIDVATITLSSAINYSDKEQPIALPDKDIVEGSTAVTSGWGVKTQGQGILIDELQNFKRNVITADKCNTENYKDMKTKVDPTEFCGSPTNVENNGFCAGDTGSPLIQDGKVIGISIWSISCPHEYPQVYANVYQHLRFLQNQLE